VRVRSQSAKVVALLTDSDPRIRVSVAQALTALAVRETLPAIRLAYLSETVPAARLFIGLALKSTGGSDADADVARMLASDVGEARIQAAKAYYASGATQWIPRIRELSADRDERVRVQAADLLACCERPTATSMLLAALSNPNPLLRREAAAVLERHALASPAVLRQLLGDTDPVVRLLGAGATLEAARR